MSAIKDISDTFFRSKAHKKYTEKCSKLILAPSCPNPSSTFQYVSSHNQVDIINQNREEDDLLNVIKSNEIEIQFLNKVISQFLDVNELIKIKQNSQYDESSSTWILPQFEVQQRKTIFPKLNKSNVRDFNLKDMKSKKYPHKFSPGPDFNFHTQFDDDISKKSPVPSNYMQDYENRPVTSCSKNRKRLQMNRIIDYDGGLRRSPCVKKKVYDKKNLLGGEDEKDH